MKGSEERMAKLAAKGYDTSKFFSATVAGKPTLLQKDSDGDFCEVVDPVIRRLWDIKHIHSAHLDGRYTFVQTMQALKSSKGWTKTLEELPYMYQFEMLYRSGNKYCELKKLIGMEKTEPEQLKIREMFFNKEVIGSLIRDYARALKHALYYNRNLFPHAKGYRKEYVKLLKSARGDSKYNIWMKDIDCRIVEPIELYALKVERAFSYEEVKNILHNFMNEYFFVNLPFSTKKSDAWVDAYKGVGAYDTARQLVWKGCSVKFRNDPIKYTDDDAIEKITEFAKSHKGWELMGLVKDILENNPQYDYEEDKMTW